jgi:hypothetical protein
VQSILINDNPKSVENSVQCKFATIIPFGPKRVRAFLSRPTGSASQGIRHAPPGTPTSAEKKAVDYPLRTLRYDFPIRDLLDMPESISL